MKHSVRNMIGVVTTSVATFSALLALADQSGPTSQPATQPNSPRVLRLGLEERLGNIPLCIAFSPDGKTLAAGGANGVLRLWDTTAGKPIYKIAAHSSIINAVAWSPNGQTIASAGADDTIRLWDVATRKVLVEIKEHTGMFSLAFSPDGKTLASDWTDNTVRLCDVAKGKPTQTLHDLGVILTGVIFSPDGKSLAVTGTSTALVEIGSGKTVRLLATDAGGVPGVAFSPDGKTLAEA